MRKNKQEMDREETLTNIAAAADVRALGEWLRIYREKERR